MPSALATQLAASASLNASLLQDRSKKRQTDSYLFTGRDAASHDLDSVHAIATSAFSHLCALSPVFLSQTVKYGPDGSSINVDFEQTLFSEAAKNMDRTLQTREVTANLDRNINAFLVLLGPWLMEAPTGKVLEWLVRRFRINEFNVDAILTLFLPYHESQHFVKMLSILHIPPTSRFSFLLAFKSAAKPLSRSALVKEMGSSVEVARFTAELLPTAVGCSYSHHTLLAFNTATMHDYISSVPRLDDGMLTFILPALLTPLQTASKDVNIALGSFVLLCVLSQKVNLKPAAILAIIGAMAAQVRKVQEKNGVSTAQFVKAAIAVCSPQDELPEFPLSVGRTCLKMAGLGDELSNALKITGAEKFVVPLLRSLHSRLHEPRVSSLFSAALNSTDVPLTMTKTITAMLVRVAMSVTSTSEENVGSTEATAHAARSLLALVHQRHFELLRDVAGDVVVDGVSLSDEGINDHKKERMKRINSLLASFSLSHPLAQSTDTNEVVVASADISKDVRTDAVHRLYAMLREAQSAESLTSSDMASIQSALLGRIYDPHHDVLQALYASPDLFLSTVTLSTTPKKLLDAIVSQLLPAPPARSILHAHAEFLADPFVKAYPELLDTVQQDALFPFLLASKAKFRTSYGVWDAINKSGGFQTGWLKGCVEVWNRVSLLEEGCEKEDTEDFLEKICEANVGVVGTIAENILASTNLAKDTKHLLSKMEDTMPHGRALAYLVCRELLVRTSDDRQITLAIRILRAMRLSTLDDTDDSLKEPGLQEAQDGRQIIAKATIKPGGRGTNLALQASILTLVPGLSPPQNFSGSWILVLPSDVSPDVDGGDSNHQYVFLMHSLYVLACSSASAPTSLSALLLRILFLNLKENSLAFLLGILLSAWPVMDGVRTHAILHILAFLRGHVGTGVDFQTVLPSLLAVLMDYRTDKRDRALVLESISLLSSSVEKKYIYGMDTIYGQSSSELQYLDTKDLTIYVKAMIEFREQVVQDANFIKVFHHRHLQGSSAKYRRRVSCYLLSHVIVHPIPFARVALLHSLEDVSDNTKAFMLVPAVKMLTQDPASVSQLFGSLFDEYISLVMAGFLTVTSANLNEGGANETWLVFIAVLRSFFRSNANISARDYLAAALEKRLFADLRLERRSEICIELLHAGAQGGEVFLASKSLVGKLLRDASLIIRLLAVFQPSRAEGGAPAGKRAKLDNPPENGESDKLQPLTILAEALATSDIPGSVTLISHLLETVNSVIHSNVWGPSDTNYLCQMLLAGIENSASKLTEALPHPIRLEILVELIRVTDNSQTFNGALLLMANLARLAPKSVLHNIMPVFTFMGSNVFHRDDSYSLKVIQNTVNSIVPVMVSSLKEKYSVGLELYVGAREFLRIFTDAANHVPRHRRQNFFLHLAEVLGPEEFLAPLCMLLVDKVINRVVRQTLEEAQTTLALPIALLRHFSRPLQIQVLCETLRECTRLVSRLNAPDEKATFLDYTRDEEHSVSASSILQRRVQVLLVFSSTVLVPGNRREQKQVPDGCNTDDLIALLVDLATLQDSDLSNITSFAQAAITRVTNAISAAEFLSTIAMILRSAEQKLNIGVLEVLAERIPFVSESVRLEYKVAMVQIINHIREIISHQSAGSLAGAALGALKAIVSTPQAAEAVALQATLPHVIKVIREKSSVDAALAVLPYYITSLGPRVIPHFREVVEVCVVILRDDLRDKDRLVSTGETAIATLQSLLTTLPAFYGARELNQVVKLYVDYSSCTATPSNPLTPLLKTLSKRAAPGTLIQVLYESWADLGKEPTKEDVHGLIGYFTVLKWSLKAAPRADLLEHLRQVFKVFLEAFDVRLTFGAQEVESYAIPAFIELVVKLNESAFRPLVRRLHDWAFVDSTGIAERKTTFCHIYIALLEYFKALMNPYMTVLIRSLTEALQAFGTLNASYSTSDAALWSGIILTLRKSFENDDGVFWREDKVAVVLPHLISQLPITVSLSSAHSSTPSGENPKQLLSACIVSLVSLLPTSAADLLKRLNLSLLMHTRSEDARQRMLALECATDIWKAEGGKLIGFVAETATFITECAEDENDSVVREAHKLKNALESVAGSISDL
ncbi:hypothetical protein EV401DRAFT_2197674 [Pisolithus croceorrhizus]|nr:hypothetical protein EV401DRAFT_2197674 [Pisolithus croceorrhizus]